ncbi:FAD-binding oxidoreductase [Aspergillus stella-maris]|uniref:FAD-binding oxidoreductase n=1 Tax=Aspergillus stella-maris TaxID=1810926 RepID=UPI003CCE4A82
MRTITFTIVSLIGALAGITSAATTGRPQSGRACCRALKGMFPNDTHLPDTPVYNAEYHNFWSSTEDLDPSCVFLPNSTAKVARGVQLFTRLNCQWATRGGGHSPIPGAANIDGGVLIGTNHLNTIEINHEEEYVRVGAGNRLGAVYDALDPHNLVSIVGRYADVGLGLALGAGFSFLSNREGMTIDNVVNYEIVIANGTVVQANQNSHPDLFWALKGGNNNFGIVTHFHLKTFPYEGTVYGGNIIHPESAFDEVADLFYDYHTRQAVDDDLTHAMPSYSYVGATDSAVAESLVVYNAAVDELPPILQPWLEVPHSNDTFSERTYGSLAQEQGNGIFNGLAVEQRLFSVYADREFLKEAWEIQLQWLRDRKDVPGLVGVQVPMPITPNQVAEGVAKGGNALGLDQSERPDESIVVILMLLNFENLSDAPRLRREHNALMERLVALAKRRVVYHPYIMLTYSGAGQEAIASYGAENVARLQRVAKAYDPTRVFQRLVPGGQKLPRR